MIGTVFSGSLSTASFEAGSSYAEGAGLMGSGAENAGWRRESQRLP